MERLAHRLVDIQVSRGKIQNEARDLFDYGYQILFEKIFCYAVVLAIGIFLGRFVEVGIICASFIPLRSYAGGIHASTSFRCLIATASVIAIGVVAIPLIYNLQGSGLLFLIFELLAIPVIWIIAPVEVKERQINPSERRHFKKCARIVLCVEIGVGIALILLGDDEAVYIPYTHVVVAISCLLEHAKTRCRSSENINMK